MKKKLKIDDGSYEWHSQFTLDTPKEINEESKISYKISKVSDGNYLVRSQL